MRVGEYRAAAVVLFLLLFSTSSVGQNEAPAEAVSEQTVSRAELLGLRPIVEKDLRALLKRVYNDDTVSAGDLENEFEQCNFTAVRLGSIGRAILVEAQAGHGATGNAAMLNLYARSGDSYRRIIDTAGFGPAIYPRAGAPPDLVFGWTSGVCYVTYYRYRFANGKYSVNGCDQEYRAKGDVSESCLIKACEGAQHYPTFQDPWPAYEGDASSSSSPTYFAGPAKTGKEILRGVHESAR